MKTRLLTLLLLIFIIPTALAVETESEDDEENEIVSEAAEGPASGFSPEFGGWVDLRPSWFSSRGMFHSENEVALEYRLAPKFELGYVQEFRWNLLRAGIESQRTGFELQLDDGYFWAEAHDLFSNSGFTLSWLPKLYVPTSRVEVAAGFVLATRQTLKANWEIAPGVDLFLWEVPIVYCYSVAGYELEDEGVANRWFENRVEVGPKLSFLGDSLELKIPVVIQSQLHRDYAEDAKNNDRWAHTLWIYPQLTWRAAENTRIGLGYYSDTLVGDNFSSWDVSTGLREGVTQLILTQYL